MLNTLRLSMAPLQLKRVSSAHRVLSADLYLQVPLTCCVKEHSPAHAASRMNSLVSRKDFVRTVLCLAGQVSGLNCYCSQQKPATRSLVDGTRSSPITTRDKYHEHSALLCGHQHVLLRINIIVQARTADRG